jgi:glutaconate CoA-transferase subunit A
MGLPFLPVRGLIGTDYLRVRPDFKIIKNPYGEDELVAVPAIRPDLLLMHAYKADAYGNVLTDKRESDPLLARAADRVVATVEEIVPSLQPEADKIIIPGIYVDAVVHCPGGARPTACPGYYEIQDAEIRRYLQAAQTPEAFRQYLEEFLSE